MIDKICSAAEAVARWAREVHDGQGGPHGPSGQARETSTVSIQSTQSTRSTYPEIAANGALALIAVACSLLSRQLASLERAFVQEGGFTERLYRLRRRKRDERED